MAALGSKGGVGCHGGKRGLLLPRLSSNTTVSKGSVFSYEMQGLERFRNATKMVCRQSDGKAHVILYQLSEHSILNIQAFKVAWPTCWFFFSARIWFEAADQLRFVAFQCTNVI